MKKSICIEKLFIDLPFYDRFAMVRKTGFDYVEFGSWEQHDVKRIKELLTENQLKLGCFSCPLRGVSGLSEALCRGCP